MKARQVNEPVPIVSAEQYFAELGNIVKRLPCALIEQIADALVSAYEREATVFLFGNGACAALASHMACDLGKGTADCNGGKRFRVMALTDNIPVITAWANDARYEVIFAEQLANFVRPNDLVFAMSASGNSRNVLNAVAFARAAGAITIGLTGYAGGKLAGMCDLAFIVPSDNMQLIEDIHASTAHALFTVVRQRILHNDCNDVAVSEPRPLTLAKPSRPR